MISFKEIVVSQQFRYLFFLALFAIWAYNVFSSGSHKHNKAKVYSKNTVYIKTTKQLNDVVSKNDLVILDFYADWCPLCKKMAPDLGRLADSHNGRVKVVKVNVEEATKLADQYKIERLPTIMVLKNGKIVDTTTVFQDYQNLVKIVEKHESVKN